MKIWKYHPEGCEICGSSSEIFTEESLEEGWGFDGDSMRCTNPDCQCKGFWSADDDNSYCNWDHQSSKYE